MSEFEEHSICLPAIIGGIYVAYKTKDYTRGYYRTDHGDLFDKTMFALLGVSFGATCGIIGIPALISVGTVIALEELDFKKTTKN